MANMSHFGKLTWLHSVSLYKWYYWYTRPIRNSAGPLVLLDFYLFVFQQKFCLYYKFFFVHNFTEKDGVSVAFNEQGDGVGRYNIRNYRRLAGGALYDYVTVGE